jgi:hypothetical protein
MEYKHISALMINVMDMGPKIYLALRVKEFFHNKELIYLILVTTMPSTTSLITTYCRLNCKNGSTPETEDGCFCYCLEHTNGRECENSKIKSFIFDYEILFCFHLVDCTQSDVDADICSLENRSLCEQSETFAFECLHLCGKC